MEAEGPIWCRRGSGRYMVFGALWPGWRAPLSDTVHMSVPGQLVGTILNGRRTYQMLSKGRVTAPAEMLDLDGTVTRMCEGGSNSDWIREFDENKR